MLKFKDDEKKCCRCRGRKKMYEIGGGYTASNFGGKQVDCPLCLGTGLMKSLEECVKEPVEKAAPVKKRSSNKQKESVHAEAQA